MAPGAWAGPGDVGEPADVDVAGPEAGEAGLELRLEDPEALRGGGAEAQGGGFPPGLGHRGTDPISLDGMSAQIKKTNNPRNEGRNFRFGWREGAKLFPGLSKRDPLLVPVLRRLLDGRHQSIHSGSRESRGVARDFKKGFKKGEIKGFFI